MTSIVHLALDKQLRIKKVVHFIDKPKTISGRPINKIFNATLTVAMDWHIKDPLIVARGTRGRNSKE